MWSTVPAGTPDEKVSGKVAARATRPEPSPGTRWPGSTTGRSTSRGERQAVVESLRTARPGGCDASAAVTSASTWLVCIRVQSGDMQCLGLPCSVCPVAGGPVGCNTEVGPMSLFVGPPTQPRTQVAIILPARFSGGPGRPRLVRSASTCGAGFGCPGNFSPEPPTCPTCCADGC